MKLSIILVMAFLVGQYQTGVTKQCVYDALGSKYTMTVQGYEICPLSINI